MECSLDAYLISKLPGNAHMSDSHQYLYRRLFIASLWLLVLFLTLALTLVDKPVDELQAMSARWSEAAPAHYRYTLATSQFGSAPMLDVAVTNGEANSPLADDPQAYTIDWLFTEINAELERGATITYSRYDRHYGYPVEISLDYHGSHDRWISYAVIDFTPGE
jgi:hypothetical protein